jgi:hypothetical protein
LNDYYRRQPSFKVVYAFQALAALTTGCALGDHVVDLPKWTPQAWRVPRGVPRRFAYARADLRTASFNQLDLADADLPDLNGAFLTAPHMRSG